jgi:hypothetical protein
MHYNDGAATTKGHQADLLDDGFAEPIFVANPVRRGSHA